jgi:hypothetical protein
MVGGGAAEAGGVDGDGAPAGAAGAAVDVVVDAAAVVDELVVVLAGAVDGALLVVGGGVARATRDAGGVAAGGARTKISVDSAANPSATAPSP